ncbi:hypothetical protein Cgig2_030781 [Carnegiea gigantea]|uniref:Reverse transcriptase zinc-binding domain-containing protein n=1 Tax=Carnegiea gigantea TaxID=171969 RepID=A0A9Q1KSA2_9CARY|nr:hypothetical protein Cgig2_030781 [Carnegiea gigantea]
MFLWLVIYDKIMHNVNQTRRGFTNNPWCEACEMTLEDSNHILRTCAETRPIWNALRARGFGNKKYDAPVNEWIQFNIRDTEADQDRPSKFGITLWHIWKWHNGRSFDRTIEIPLDKVSFLKNRNQRLIKRLVKWTTPSDGWILLNSDRAAKVTQDRQVVMGFSEVLREEWLGGYAKAMGICSIVKAKLKALFHRLRLARC